MYPPDQMRAWAVDLRACAARCKSKDHMDECLMLATRCEDMAATVEQFLSALVKADTPPPRDWRVGT